MIYFYLIIYFFLINYGKTEYFMNLKNIKILNNQSIIEFEIQYKNLIYNNFLN